MTERICGHEFVIKSVDVKRKFCAVEYGSILLTFYIDAATMWVKRPPFVFIKKSAFEPLLERIKAAWILAEHEYNATTPAEPAAQRIVPRRKKIKNE